MVIDVVPVVVTVVAVNVGDVVRDVVRDDDTVDVSVEVRVVVPVDDTLLVIVVVNDVYSQPWNRPNLYASSTLFRVPA